MKKNNYLNFLFIFLVSQIIEKNALADYCREAVTKDGLTKVTECYSDENNLEIPISGSNNYNNGEEVINYTFDEKGNVSSESNGGYKVEFTYDENGRVISETDYNYDGIKYVLDSKGIYTTDPELVKQYLPTVSVYSSSQYYFRIDLISDEQGNLNFYGLNSSKDPFILHRKYKDALGEYGTDYDDLDFGEWYYNGEHSSISKLKRIYTVDEATSLVSQYKGKNTFSIRYR